MEGPYKIDQKMLWHALEKSASLELTELAVEIDHMREEIGVFADKIAHREWGVSGLALSMAIALEAGRMIGIRQATAALHPAITPDTPEKLDDAQADYIKDHLPFLKTLVNVPMRRLQMPPADVVPFLYPLAHASSVNAPDDDNLIRFPKIDQLGFEGLYI